MPSETAETTPTKRTQAEAAVRRFSQVIGEGLRSRTGRRRATEVDVAISVLNRMLERGLAVTVRIAETTAGAGLAVPAS